MFTLRLSMFVSLATLAFVAGCDKKPTADNPTATTQPTTQTSSVQVRRVVVFKENSDWTVEQALQKLTDPKEQVRAAIRLVRLSQNKSAAILTPPISLDVAETLGVRQLDEGLWAIGVASTENSEELWDPVVIDAEGTVTTFDDGSDDTVVLYVSEDTDIAPHFVVTKDCVLLPTESPELAFKLKDAEHGRLDLRYYNDLPYVGLMLRREPSVESTFFKWDVAERVFMGPAVDFYEKGKEEKFKVDLSQSNHFEAVGGIIDDEPYWGSDSKEEDESDGDEMEQDTPEDDKQDDSDEFKGWGLTPG